MPRVYVLAQTISSVYGPLVPGQVLDVDERHAAHWAAGGIAEPVAEPEPTTDPEPAPESEPAKPKGRRKE